MARTRAASTGRWRSATAAAARVTTFTLYGSFALGDLPRHRGMRQRQPEPEPGHAQRLGEGAQHDQRELCASSGSAVGPPNSWYASSHTTSAPVSSSTRSHRARRERRAGGVVRRVEHHDPRPLAHRGLDQRVRRRRRNRARAAPADSGRPARRSAADTARTSASAPPPRPPAPSSDRQRGLDQLVGPVAHEHAVRRPAIVLRPDAASSAGGANSGYRFHAAALRRLEHLALDLGRQIPRALVLVELPARRRRAERVGASAPAPPA